MSNLEEVWNDRETRIYPEWFGGAHRGPFYLNHDFFLETFGIGDPELSWTHHSIFEFAPRRGRNSWVYVSSGLSNPWYDSPEDYHINDYSGLGVEFVMETPGQSIWAIAIMQRLVAYNILLDAGKLGEYMVLDYGTTLPLHGPINITGGSELQAVGIFYPDHYKPVFHLESGNVDLLHIMGLSIREFDFCRRESAEMLLKRLKKRGVYPMTDPSRKSVV